MAIAPELTIGFVRPPSPLSIAASELKARPVAFMPIFSRASCGPSTSQISAKTNGFETLMIVNS